MDQPSVLVVEDDFLIQVMVEDALVEGGFLVVKVASAEEALTLFAGNADPHRALITDIELKGRMNGWDLARRLREAMPDLPVIYTTGSAADQWPSLGVPGSVLLAKPFAPAQLITALSQLLNAHAARPSGPT